MSVLLKQLGPYHLHEEISSDNGILVYYVTDTRTRQEHLLYLLDSWTGPDALPVEHFFKAVEAARHLRHPHILTFAESGELDGYHYAATQPLYGVSLAHELRYGATFSVPAVTAIVQQIAAALDYAYGQGFLHGALSPDEIWIAENGRVQVSGFCIAQAARQYLTASSDGVDKESLAPDVSPYVAPEQAQGADFSDQSADVYSLCAVTYAMLMGRPPSEDEQRLLREQSIHQPPALSQQSRPDLLPLAATVLQFGLAKDPSTRYGAAGEFASAFARAHEVSRSEATGVYANPLARLQDLWVTSESIRTRYGLLVAVPLLIIVVLVGMLFVSRSFSSASSSQIGLRATEATVETSLPTPVNAEVVSAAPMLDDAQQTAATTAPTVEPPLATATTAPTVETPEPTPTVEQSLAPVAPPLETTVATVTVEAEPVVALTSTVAVSETVVVTSTPTTVTQPLAAFVRTLAGQIIENVGPLTITTPIESEPVADAPSEEPQPTPEAEHGQQAESATDSGLHLPLVMQSIYAEGIVNQTANLRAGPGTSFGIMAIAQRGQHLTVVACNEDCSWYQLAGGEWIAAFLVDLVAKLSEPLPVATPTP